MWACLVAYLIDSLAVSAYVKGQAEHPTVSLCALSVPSPLLPLENLSLLSGQQGPATDWSDPGRLSPRGQGEGGTLQLASSAHVPLHATP